LQSEKDNLFDTCFQTLGKWIPPGYDHEGRRDITSETAVRQDVATRVRHGPCSGVSEQGERMKAKGKSR
jgi:hypothetical protein